MLVVSLLVLGERELRHAMLFINRGLGQRFPHRGCLGNTLNKCAVEDTIPFPCSTQPEPEVGELEGGASE